MTTTASEMWHHLYRLAMKIKSLKPWEYIHEYDVFGIQHPLTKEIGFASVMGFMGEHYSITFYMGAEGLAMFWNMRNNAEKITPEVVLEIPQLQLNFEDREILQKEDLALLKDLGLSFRGRASWPVFKRQVPGFFPWLLEDHDLDWMIMLTEQSIDIMARIKTNPEMIEMAGEDDYLVRTAIVQENTLVWKDTIQIIKPSLEYEIDILVPMPLMERARRLSRRNITVELDVRLLPSPIWEKHSKPYFPYMLLAVEVSSGMILGFETIPPLPDLKTMRQNLPQMVVSFLLNKNLLPAKIHYRPSLSMDHLIPVFKALQIQTEKKKKLSNIDEAWSMMVRNL
ncbi:MAG: hypothetical protein PHD61_12635 [Bacteroidales bacterium]|nr:hypothetical protein [Lentimicrobiaceae bacterium]MDD5696136.1 hypothetical protein [Bacteroidales bacterium]